MQTISRWGTLKIPSDSKERKDARPLPILNTSLNAVRGKELALQTRKARSFAFTPLYGGFTRQALGKKDWEAYYAPTEKLASRLPAFKEGVMHRAIPDMRLATCKTPSNGAGPISAWRSK